MVRRVAKRTFLDTAYPVALVSSRDQHHARAVELSSTFDRRPLLTTDAVLIEIGNALSGSHRPQAVGLIHDLLTSPEVVVVHITPELFDRGFELYRTHADKDWGLTDCLSFVVMREYGVTDALAHDQHFVQAGFVALMR